ncbi:transcription factor HES-3 [Suncus etruscus]|uniref:transcription factor HES-3 n=1 Tax=Suncus etruscus TaxID=109475 RepID=UPI002110654A|nr:transcription factor HES-3 [Suncus etruscus]
MEKKRRARINVSLEQLRFLLEKHYSHQIRKRKLEKADILELSVKYMKSLQNSVQGFWPLHCGTEYASSFSGCLSGCLPGGGGGLRCPLAHERAGRSTLDSASPAVPASWGSAPAPGSSGSGSGSPPPPPRLPDPSTSIPAPPPTPPLPPPSPSRRAQSPGPGVRVWRPW